MKKEEVRLLRDIQKNTRMGLKAIDSISSRVEDDALALRLSGQALKYEQLHEKASRQLARERESGYQESYLDGLLLRGGILGRTMLNAGTSRLAEVLIRENNNELTDLWRSVNRNRPEEGFALEIARELADFEEKNIWELRKFL